MPALTVLLVNEEAESAAMYSALLSRVGYRVLTADGPEAALECALANRPDVIVTELRERTTDGWRTPQLLKSDTRVRAIPIIALTSRVLPDDRVRAEKSGCDLFLAKPIMPRELADVIAKLTASRDE